MLETEVAFLSALVYHPEEIGWIARAIDTKILSSEAQWFWNKLNSLYKEYGGENLALVPILMDECNSSPPRLATLRKILEVNVISGEMVKSYYSRLVNQHRRQKAMTLITEVGQQLKNGEEVNPMTIVEQLQSISVYTEGTGTLMVDQELQNINSEIGREFELPTGIRQLDNFLGGLRRGELFVVGGDTSSGKTAFAFTCLLHLASRGIRTLLNAIEGTQSQFVRRLLSMETGITTFLPQTRGLSRESFDKLKLAGEAIKKYPIGVLERETNLQKMYLYIKYFRPEVVIVDYLQLFPSPKGSESRVKAVGEIARNLTMIAENCNVAMMVLSQFHREACSAIRRPTLNDLRESGEIEQNAGVVGLLYWKWLYDHKADVRTVDFIIAKNKNGPLGEVKLYFEPQKMRFYGQTEQKEEQW